jgi:predicted methyltransferase
MFAVDERELITMVLFWGLNLEVMVVYDLGDGGGFYVRISSDD